MAKCDLSVAIIFKNEIRCLERCLKSLQPLRERLSLQIVMADTGATDGSREVAERYADVLIDFPWINDFAAARNATLKRCRGKWTLVMDCDEWLDGDVKQLVGFLRNGNPEAAFALIPVRSYTNPELTQYSDVSGMRLLRMSAEPRYVGAIHEYAVFARGGSNGRVLGRTILHHDGYIMLNDGSEAGKAKRLRNRELLCKDLERDPDSLRTISLYLDIEDDAAEYWSTMRRALQLIEEQHSDWEVFGPPLLRSAIVRAYISQLPEFDQWAEKAFLWFPESCFVRIDVNYNCFFHAYDREDYAGAIRYGEEYLKACAEFDSNLRFWSEQRFSTVQYRSEACVTNVTSSLLHCHYECKQYDRVFALLQSLSWEKLDASRVKAVLILLLGLHVNAGMDVSELVAASWNGVCIEKPTQEQAFERRAAFLEVGWMFFANDATVFLPLRGKCILGDAAALLNAETTEEADIILANADDPTQLPAAAFIHALKLGAEFPVPGKTLTTDQIAALAEKLLIDPPFLREAAKFAASAAQTEQEVMWAYALAKVALNQATANLLPHEEEDDEEEEDEKWL